MYRAILFDLYDTLVVFQPHVPTVNVEGMRWRSTMGWMTEALAREIPAIALDDFVRAIMETTAEIVRDRPPEYREVASRERFRRALVRLGLRGDGVTATAERLSRAHMQHIAAMIDLPRDHLVLLRTLAVRYPLGLVSNFDHAETARAILLRHGLTELFTSVVISDEFGRRKPHPSIFAEALRQMALSAADAVFVGDSLVDDVSGAHAAGMDAVWLNPKAAPLPDGAPVPQYTITRLPELETVLNEES